MERLEQEGSDDDGNENSIDDALRRAGGLAPDFMKCLVRERHRGRGGVSNCRLIPVKTTTGDVERVILIFRQNRAARWAPYNFRPDRPRRGRRSTAE